MDRDPIAVLLSLVEALSQEALLEEHLAAVTNVALVVLPGDHASIRLVDDSGDELVASARSGAGSDHPSVPLRKGVGIAGWVLEQGRAALVMDAHGDPRFLASTEQGFAIRSIVAAPLLHHRRAIGVLSVSSAKAGAFSGSHETMARYLLPRLSEELQRARAEGRAVTLGHACGDAVLRIFADRVREGTRRSDVFVRRG